MKGFERSDLSFSLCGLNCGLCPMKLGGHCGGCGNGNQSCRIARCSLEQPEKVEYCFQCGKFPCERYEDIDRFDSFITHQNRMADLRRAKEIGPAAYRREQEEKAGILERLLSQYNDGRRKTLYCVGVNLLPLEALRGIMGQLEEAMAWKTRAQGEKAAYAAALFQQEAKRYKIELKLRKKSGKKEV